MSKAKTKRWFAIAGGLLALGVFLCSWDFIQAAESGAVPAAVAPGTPAPQAPPSDKVRVTFTVWPPSLKAMVFWGRRRLGMIEPHKPLIVERPRDSGPLDVIVRAQGFLPVQTRAYTFADSKVSVKMTPPEQKKTLLGYREAVPDGGVTPAESHTPDAGAGFFSR